MGKKRMTFKMILGKTRVFDTGKIISSVVIQI
jgi:hypothetical protein